MAEWIVKAAGTEIGAQGIRLFNLGGGGEMLQRSVEPFPGIQTVDVAGGSRLLQRWKWRWQMSL